MEKDNFDFSSYQQEYANRDNREGNRILRQTVADNSEAIEALESESNVHLESIYGEYCEDCDANNAIEGICTFPDCPSNQKEL